MDDKRRESISKTMSFMLRHGPGKFKIILDPEGFTLIDDVVVALGRKFKGISRSDVLEVVERCEKGRFEVRGDEIRACYGHSIPIRIQYDPVEPPEILLHGTAHRFLDDIMRVGLRPMDRQYVHLTIREDFAREVGRRRDKDPVILKVEALKAHRDGVRFYKANENFYLADLVPACYIKKA
jgi:putative RNA 2'-phosphotransferase